VADGLPAAGALDSAADFFKPLNINKLIICTPVASVEAVDRAHIVGDELHILSVTDNYLDTGHYYESNEVPSHSETLRTLSNIVLGWAERPSSKP
jgi:predicted phosphoribosyltransferase